MNDYGGGTPAPDDEYDKRRQEAKQRREESEEKADKVGSLFFSLVTGGFFGLAVGFAAEMCKSKDREALLSPSYTDPYQPDLWCTVLTAENFHPEMMGIAVGLVVSSLAYLASYLYFHYLAP